jgi:hypothetical protein
LEEELVLVGVEDVEAAGDVGEGAGEVVGGGEGRGEENDGADGGLGGKLSEGAERDTAAGGVGDDVDVGFGVIVLPAEDFLGEIGFGVAVDGVGLEVEEEEGEGCAPVLRIEGGGEIGLAEGLEEGGFGWANACDAGDEEDEVWTWGMGVWGAGGEEEEQGEEGEAHG